MFATKQKSGQEAASMPANRGHRPVLPVNQHGTTEFLQRHLGNSRFQQLVTPAGPVLQRKCACGGTCASCSDKQEEALPIQAKLRVGPANDRYERQADRVADAVMRMPDPQLQREPMEEEEEMLQPKRLAAQITPLVQRQSMEEEEEMFQPKLSVQRWAQADGGDSAPPVAHDVLRAPGQPLDAATRSFMEPRFGADFSQVRVHTDVQAAAAARSVQARAYTTGRHMVFGAGQYAPGTIEGKRLMAHELTHVVQQRAGAVKAYGSVAKAPSRIQRTAASCPSDWSATVAGDHSRALDMIDVARTKLSSYNGATPTEVHTALDRHFKATSSGFAGWVNFNLGYLRLIAPVAGYDCEDSSSWWCASNPNAKTFWCVPGFDIRVCQPNYFGQSDIERSETLIHEWVHKYGCNFELGTQDIPEYPSQWTITALLNADPWSEFVQDVQ